MHSTVKNLLDIKNNIKNVDVPASLLSKDEPQQEESLLAKGEM